VTRAPVVHWGFVCAAIAAEALAPSVAAQEKERTLDGELDAILTDTWVVVAAPFDPTGEDLATAGMLLAGGGLLLLADGPVQEWVRSHPSSLLIRAVAPFRVGGLLEPLGRTPVLIPLSAVAWLVGAWSDQPKLRDAGMGCASTSLATLALRTATTLLLPRARPQEERGPFAFERPQGVNWVMQSFPSGHAANPGACVSFLTHRFDMGAAEPLLWAIPVAAGLSRLPDEAHWLSDTYLGLALGYAVGRAVAGRSLEREAERNPTPALVLTLRVPF
jgi:membrane-associated phospholipid phosphatase